MVDKKAKARQVTGKYAFPGMVNYKVVASKHGASVVDLRFNKCKFSFEEP